MHGWTSTHFFLCFSLLWGLPRDQCTLYMIDIIHIVFLLSEQCIIITSWDSPVALISIGLIEFDVVHRSSSGRFHRDSTLRFIEKGCEVPRVLVHLFSNISLRQGAWLYCWYITTTVMSTSICASLLMCSSTGVSSVLLCAVLKWSLLIVRNMGSPVLPTSCWPHLLQVIKWIISKDLWKVASFFLKT